MQTTPRIPTRTLEPTPVLLDPTISAVEGWTTYRSEAGGYMLPVPSNWTIDELSQTQGWIEFADPSGRAGGDTPTVHGGISLPGRYAAEAGGQALTNGLPDNHREIVAEQALSTPAGAGKIFTLKRDTPPRQNAIWYEQYAVIPGNQIWYVVWLKIPAAAAGTTAPELTTMMASFQLINGNKPTEHP
ncbi:MAG: hypothetical protein JST60_05415 [Chloroflexi bacterium SZAS-1]|nr:hypothetical protein [Chloroflexi bacterium SZAS-1]